MNANLKIQTQVSKQFIGRGISLRSILPFIVFLIVYAFMPRFAKDSQIATLIFIGINVLLALGLNLLMGYAGQISLGHAAFFGIGAYISAIMTVRPIPLDVIPGFSVGIGVMAGCAVLISLTKFSGMRLAAGVAVLIVISWLARLVHLNLPLTALLFGVTMAIYGIVVRVSWWKSSAAGICAWLSMVVCKLFLAGVLQRGGASPWTGMIIGVLITGLIAYLIGGQVLRLKGHYLAMATLGFGVIIEIVFRQWTAVTGGSSDGIYGIPTIQVMESLPSVIRRLFTMVAGGHIDARQEYYYLVWAFVFVSLILANNIVRSRVGRAFRAVHGSETAAESLGVDTERYKVQVFVMSAALASLAGSLYAHNAGIGYISPSEFNFMVSVQLVVMVVIGGMASIWGALLGAAAIQMLKNWLLNIDRVNPQVFGLTLKGLDPIVFGAVLIIVMIVLPQGLVRGIADSIAVSLRAATRSIKKKAE